MPINSDQLVQVDCGLSEKLLPWLNHQQSLTDKLKNQTGEAVVHVLHQDWLPSNWWASHVLQLTEPAMHREILMTAHEETCWYARTFIPQSTYSAHHSFFNCLNFRPLGHLIFANSFIHRKLFINYAINPQCIEYHWLTDSVQKENEFLWTRLSEFTIHQGYSFYLLEILLPGLLKVIK